MVIKDVAFTIDDVAKALLETHEVYARKYAADGHQPAFFLIAVPKGMVLSATVVSSMGGAMVASLVQAAHGD